MNSPLPRCMIRATLVAVISLLLVACGTPAPASQPTLTPSATATLTPTLLPTQTATPTPLPPLAVLLAPPGSDEAQVASLQTLLHPAITGAGLQWQVRQQLHEQDMTAALRLVVAVAPDPGLALMAEANPAVQFLAVGIPGLSASANLSVTGVQGARPDQQGFIAGVMAAMISPDWRVGVISLSDTPQQRAARTGFLNGAAYYCGLCLQAYPPFYDYPTYFELPASATSAEWQAAASYMIDHYVLTVYVAPGAGDPAMLSYLVAAGVNLIGSGVPDESLRPNWVASLGSDPLPVVQSAVASILQGQAGQDIPLPLDLSQVNPDLFSPGKQDNLRLTLDDLLAGYIDTGVDMATGENR